MVQWLACLPGMQEIRGSSPSRGMTDFCMSIFILFILMPVMCNSSNLLKILNSDTVEHVDLKRQNNK